MSQISHNLGLLQSQHKGVHEQFDFLIVAMQVQATACTEVIAAHIATLSDEAADKWLQEQAMQAFHFVVGSKPGFLQRRVLLYVLQLYEQFFESYTQVLKFKEGTPLKDVQYSILPLAAQFLDTQFQREGRADICAFLKGRP